MKRFLLALLLLPLLTFGQDAPTYYEEGSVPLKGDSKIILEHKIAGGIFNALAELLNGPENVTTAPTYLSPGGPEPQQSDSEIMLLHRIAAGVNELQSEIGGSSSVAWGDITSKPTTLSGYGITDPVVLTSGTYADPSWLTALAAGKLTGDVAFSNITQLPARSVLGVAGNVTADVAAITASTDHQVLRRSGTTVGFGAVNLSQSAAVTGVLAASNGGYPVGHVGKIAWLDQGAGSDATGQLGNPARPYLTMAAAQSAGALTFILGPGTYAGLTQANAGVPYAVMGAGLDATIITNFSVTGDGVGLRIHDLGNKSCKISTVAIVGATQGNDVGSVDFRGVRAETVTVTSLDGSGGMPDGGDSGDISETSLIDCEIGTIAFTTGNGGNGAPSDGNGGSSGSIGAMTIYRTSISGGITTTVGSAGTPDGAGAGGATGTVGSITGNFNDVRLNIGGFSNSLHASLVLETWTP